MAQRRKIETSVASKPDNVGLSFLHVAGAVTNLYHQYENLQPVSFEAGRKHSLTKVHEWILSQILEGKLVTSTDIITYVQKEVDKTLSTESRLNGTSACTTTSIEKQEPDENASQDMEEDPPRV